MERETKEITTPNGHKIKIYTYLTGREARQIDDISISAIDLSNNTRQSIDPKTIRMAEDKMIELLVLSVDDDVNDVLDAILDLPAVDYTFVFSELESLVGNMENAKKK